MRNEDILDVVMKYRHEWAFEEIGAFVYVALTEDLTEENIMRILGMEAGGL